MKIFLSLFFLLICGISAQERNFLFILVDDLGRQDLGVEGSTFHETPNIDALARRGTRFAFGYSACQVCSPSRASIMLGKATPRHGITDYIGAASGQKWNRNDKVMPAEYSHVLPAADVTLAEAMKAGGYKTFFAGKWHLGGKGSYPEDHGFDINIGGHEKGTPPGGFFSPYNNPKMSDGPAGESLTLRLAKDTAAFLETSKDQKFFAYLSFYAVHAPVQTTQELWKKYRDKAEKMDLVGKTSFKFDRTKPVRQIQNNPLYAGMMETLDTAVGIVMDKLKETGLDKNTVVIFTSDNGGVSSGDAFATSALPFRGGKGRQWEGGLRQPFYIYVPGMGEKQNTDAPAIGMDFYPTILELAGLPLKPEQHMDGVSLVPVLEGKTLAPRDLFWHYPHYGNQGGEPSSVIHSGNWKLIHYYEDGRDELYNISNDVGEQNDVISANAERAKSMRAELDKWLKDTGAIMPQQDSRFNTEKKKAVLDSESTKGVERLENTHEKYLDLNYQPGKDWWGSKPVKK
jgi:arylsulfatase A-like enzyme